MADTWNEEVKEVLAGLSATVAAGQGGPAEVNGLLKIKEPPTGQASLCKAHSTVWTTMRDEMLAEGDPPKATRRAWLTKWLTKHERVIAGIAACPGCERPAPTTPQRDAGPGDAPPRRRRTGPPRRR